MDAGLQPELFIIGLGVSIPEHVTIQAARALAKCIKVYSIVQEPPSLWLPPDCLEKIEVVNALELYEEGNLRTDNYQHVARAIVGALCKGKSLGYVTYGSPMAYDRVAQNLIEYAAESRFRFQIVPGISSLDTVLCDLHVDMAPAIQVVEASWLFACQIQLHIGIPVLLVQVGAFGSLRTHYRKRSDGASLAELIEYLYNFYPRSHPVSLIRSTGQEGEPARIRHVALERLSAVTADDLSGASLYIPALTQLRPHKALISKMEQS
jgi:uncharacterized protein YabN with tetrapyrrole methylase and pyrophosphatase domain